MVPFRMQAAGNRPAVIVSICVSDRQRAAPKGPNNQIVKERPAAHAAAVFLAVPASSSRAVAFSLCTSDARDTNARRRILF